MRFEGVSGLLLQSGDALASATPISSELFVCRRSSGTSVSIGALFSILLSASGCTESTADL